MIRHKMSFQINKIRDKSPKLYHNFFCYSEISKAQTTLYCEIHIIQIITFVLQIPRFQILTSKCNLKEFLYIYFFA